MKNILITGGAGYIGSVIVKKLVNKDYNVVVVDNLSKGRKELVDDNAKFYELDILDRNKLDMLFKRYNFDVVIHMAAAKDAGESMINLNKYSDNLVGSINLIELADKYKVNKFIFSSSAAVYGSPLEKIITEEHPTNPINYYGFTKLQFENMLQWYSKQKDITTISLRYFNVAGDAGLNYVDPKASNVFPILSEVFFGKRDKFVIYGDNYDTKDGTCVRDYVHVSDIADAHILALNLDQSEIINLGTGKGTSVLELVNGFSDVTGIPINYKVGARRPGDPPYLVASNEKAKKLLNWEPKHNLEDMIKSTLNAYKDKGY